MRFLHIGFISLLSLLGLDPGNSEEQTNVVFILTDNHGAWTLGCYGNPDIRTPHLDQMAREGIRFENAFCNNAVCSPTRATYLTGLMPSQHGVHNFLVGNRLQTGPEARNTLETFTTLPEILKASGYACGLVGKWHLGNNLHPNEGFDDYWITMPHGGTSTFHNARVIENGEIRKEPTYLTEFWTEHALKFLDEHQEEPFFLFLAYNGPYGLSSYQLEPSGNRHTDYYADKEMPSFPRGVNHPWQFPNRAYFGNPTSIRRYSEELSAVDDGVGAVLARLKSLGIDDNTLVVFAADQGWAGGQRGVWGMGDHTRPVNAFEHSMRIPLIFRHPGTIPGDRVSPLATSNYDFMPTILGYLGLGEQMPMNPLPPGRDYSFELRETISPYGEWGDEVFYEYESLRCIRNSDWKLVDRYDDDDYHELYHLSEDPTEQINLYGNPEYASVQAALQNHLDLFFSIHATETYDLWRGGTSQTKYYVWDKTPEQELQAAIDGSRPWAPSVIDPSWNPPSIQLPDGLVAEVAAASPLVQHPVMATLDDSGRLFVCENAGLNLNREELEKQKPNSVRLLEDRNGDGIYDKSTVFADKLTFPQGALWHRDALYVMSPPSLWRFRDTDNDNIADEREELVTGFDFTGNAADVHGPFLHPNGRLFWCHGRKGHEVHDPATGKLLSKNKGARIWSCNLDGSDLQVFAGGGMDNPVELVFAPNGDIIGDVNLFYGRPRGDVLVHWLEGGVYPRRDQQAVIDEFTRTGPLLEEIHDFGHVAVSGITLSKDKGAILPDPGDKDELNLLTTHFNTQKITHTVLAPHGSTWGHQRTGTLLKFDDPDVHLTDVIEDANGDLLVLDTGGWFRIGCPTSQIAKPDVTGAIYRIRPAGKRHKSVYQGPPEVAAISAQTIDFLIGGDALLERFKDTSTAPSERISDTWALTRTPEYEPDSLLIVRLNDENAEVREAACAAVRWIQLRAPKKIEPVLIDLLLTDTPPISRAAATALAIHGGRRSSRALLRLLQKDDLDLEHRHAAIHALIQLGHEAYLRTALASPRPDEVSAALLALDGTKASEAADVLSHLHSPHQGLRDTAIDILSRHPEWVNQLSANLVAKVNDSDPVTPELREVIQQLAPRHIASPEIQHLVTLLLTSSDPQCTELGFSVIAASSLKSFQTAWKPAFETALRSNDAGSLSLALDALSLVGSASLDPVLKAIVGDATRPAITRVRALRAISGKNQTMSRSAFELLAGLISTHSTPQQRLDAAIMLGKSRLTQEQLLSLADLTAQAGPLDLPHLLAAFQRTRSKEVGVALTAALPNSPGIHNIAPTELQRLMSRFPPEVTKPLQNTIDDILANSEHRQNRLATLEPKLAKGDPLRGKKAFLAGKGACIVCHQVGDQGRAVGPDLTTIGRIRTGRDLLESVLYPNESLARDFETWNVTLSDGNEHLGLIQQESAEELLLITPAAEEITIPRDHIKSIEPIPLSIMPAGLEHSLPEDELIDLVSYLKSLK